MKSRVFRPLRRSIQGSALKTRALLKKVDQNFCKGVQRRLLLKRIDRAVYGAVYSFSFIFFIISPGEKPSLTRDAVSLSRSFLSFGITVRHFFIIEISRASS